MENFEEHMMDFKMGLHLLQRAFWGEGKVKIYKASIFNLFLT